MNWNPYKPQDKDVQVSSRADMLACAPFSLVHCIEMWLKFKTGYFWEWSERALASVSQVSQAIGGTSIQHVLDGINGTGLLLTDDWPELLYSTNYVPVTWTEFYAPLPDSVKQKAYRFNIQAQKIMPSQVAQALTFAPVWAIISVGSTSHIVAQMSSGDGAYGLGTYYDSYEITTKDFQPNQPIISQYQLTIIPKNMPNAIFVQKAGTQEFGFYLPALSPDAVKDKALNLGLPITKPDGTVDFTLAKAISGL